MKNEILVHCGSRGVRGGLLFEKKEHYETFFEILGELCEELGVVVIDYALLTNHLHLLLKILLEFKTEFLQRLNWNYAIRFNLATQQHGHVFEERCWSFARQGSSVTPHTMGYIALNPLKANLCTKPEDYEYSGYAATIGLRNPQPWHRPEKGLQYLSPNLQEARLHFRRIVDSYSNFLDSIKSSGRRWFDEHGSSRALNTVPDVEFATLIDLHIAHAISARTLEVPLGLDGFDMRLLAMKWMAGASNRQIAAVWDIIPHAVHWRLRRIYERFKRMPKAEEMVRTRIALCLKRAPGVIQNCRTQVDNG